MTFRPVTATSLAKPAMEGAGVHLHRVFGFGDPSETDPFLMMDDFRNDDPQFYEKGFPWHPHRGIETITYVLEGEVEHGDSLGNRGTLGAARSQNPNSANSQFFIMFAPAPHLNGAYTVVGQVTEGMDVVDAIKKGAGRNGEVIGRPDVMESVVVID